MNDLIRPALYQAHHEILTVTSGLQGERQAIDVVGPVCETGDFFARDREMPPFKQGDLLAILDAGAYGMSSKFQLQFAAAAGRGSCVGEKGPPDPAARNHARPAWSGVWSLLSPPLKIVIPTENLSSRANRGPQRAIWACWGRNSRACPERAAGESNGDLRFLSRPQPCLVRCHGGRGAPSNHEWPRSGFCPDGKSLLRNRVDRSQGVGSRLSGWFLFRWGRGAAGGASFTRDHCIGGIAGWSKAQADQRSAIRHQLGLPAMVSLVALHGASGFACPIVPWGFR